MNSKFKLLIGGLSLAAVSIVVPNYFSKQNVSEKIKEQRKTHSAFIKNSPLNETLKWGKRERKNKGLPPNRYFDQMQLLTMNPSTGEMEDGKLAGLREELLQKRAQRAKQRNPGENGNAWVERGPNNVGGRTRVVLFDPNDATNNIVYAGGVSGGLWRNTNISNANTQWTRVENVPGNLSVTSITVDPRNNNRWYVGTGEQYTAGDVVGNGVYVTTDGGTTWNSINIPAAGTAIINHNASNVFLSGIHYVNDILAWDNGASTELFVAVGAHIYGDSSSPKNWLGLQSAGIYRSTNNGTTWNRIESANMKYTFSGNDYYYIPNDIEVSANNTIWMGTIKSVLDANSGGRVYSSADGATWAEAAASPLTNSNRVELETSATDSNKIYALTQGTTNAAPVHIYKTTDGFATANAMALPNDADNGIPAADFCRGQSFYDLVIEADPSDDDTVYVGGIDLFKTTNGGTSWTQRSKWSNNNNLAALNVSVVHADQHSIAFGNNDSSKILFGNDGGIYYSGNSGTAINVRNKGYNVTQFVKASIGPDGAGDVSGIFSAGAQDNGTQGFRNAVAGVNSSTEVSGGDGFYTFVDKDGEYMIATYVNNVIYRFSLPWNGNGRRQGGATTIFNNQCSGQFVNPMDYDSNANRLLTDGSPFDCVTKALTHRSIRSINVAANTNGELRNDLLTAAPSAFRASPFVNNTWYVGLTNGELLKLTNVTNTAATWSKVDAPFVGSISSVRFGATANDIFVTIHNYGVTSVWSTSNGGTDWVSKEGDLPNIPVRDLLQNPLDRSEAILATQLGVWSTSNFNDANPTWTQAYNGMSDVSVTSFDYWDVSGDNITNKVIASTYGRGVFTGVFTANAVADNQVPTTPTGLSASSIAATSLTLNWAASNDNIGVTGYDVYQGAIKLGSSATTSYNVTGLTASTAYTFTVKAKDAAGNISVASNIANATTTAVAIDYCTSSGNTSYATGITRVVFGSINKADGPAKNVGYENFTSLSNTVSQSSSVDLTVSVNTDGNYRIDAIAWIDWNQDGDFTDNGETYDLGNGTNLSNGALPTKAVVVPANAKVGATRMRVSARYNSNPTSCQTNFDGEVEDYTVNVQAVTADTEAPTVPTSVVTSNVAQTTLTLGWTASTDNVGVAGYDVYKGTTKLATVTTTSYNVTGLTASTAYTFTVKAKDEAGNISGASNIANATTAGVVLNYCASSGNTSYATGITRVVFGSINKADGPDKNVGYENFTSLNTTVSQSSSVDLTVSVNTDGNYRIDAIAWIDWNQDGDFADSGETYDLGNVSNVANGVLRTKAVVVPANAKVGATRMRVSARYNSNPTSCQTNFDGEVEDYTVNITSASSTSVETLLNNDLFSDSLENNDNLSVYPVPAIDDITVKFGNRENVNYRIMNTLGQVVLSGKTINNKVNVSELKGGMYLLEVNDGEKFSTKKLVKR